MIWVDQLRGGGRVRLSRFVTLTPEGIEWSGVRKSKVRWDGVEYVEPWTMSVRGMRTGRGVRLRAAGKLAMISCSKRNFVDVMATCVEMSSNRS